MGYKMVMPARAALLSLVLAGPGLAAPPASTVDNDAILGEINAADPTITRPPAPLERLLAAAELAEERLHDAVDPDAASDLLTLTAAARKVAYQRTGEAVHLCRLMAAAELVLGRGDLPAGLSAAATDFREEARGGLGTYTCTQDEAEADPLLHVPSRPAPRLVSLSPIAARSTQRRGPVSAGAVLLGAAALTAAALLPVQIRRARAYRELETLIAEVEEADGKTLEQAQRIDALYGVHTRTYGARIGLGVSAAVLAVVGVGLLVAGNTRSTSTRARVEPYGGPLGAGVVISGRF